VRPLKFAGILLAVGFGLATVGLAGLVGSTATVVPAGQSPTAQATASIPAEYLALYQQAAAVCPGLSWALLAGVGTVESGNGTNNGPSSAGAVGPMQFEPATFARYALPVPPGGAVPASPWDPTDAVFAAARYLCTLGVVSNPHDALIAYNCGNPGPSCQAVSAGYAAEVLALAGRDQTTPPTAATPAGAIALAYATSQLGVAYRWGGETPGGGFDCSGLVQWAYAQAGVAVPRTAQTQYDTGPAVAVGTPAAPGDLLFFGGSSETVGHVGIYLGQGLMIDAPHTGAVVREEPTPTRVGGGWGSDLLVGITSPV
jgi:cell wall-associated NlpC family hydrolase